MFFDDGHMVGMHGWWWLFWLVLIGAVLLGGWGIRLRNDPRARESPLQVLQRRLANGEISAQDYEERKRLLDRDASAGQG